MEDREGHRGLPEQSFTREAAKEQFLSLFKDCHFPEDKLTVNGKLGSGTYAKVYDCILRETDGRQRRVAVKKMDASLFQDEQNVLDFFRETQFLSVARNQHHPNILTFIGVSYAALEEDTEPSLCIIEEYMNNGTLKSMIEGLLQDSVKKGKRDALKVILDVAKGLAFLHDSSVSVIHRDIKPANVLIHKDPETGHMTAKLADFGLSVLVYRKRQQEHTLQDDTNDRHVDRTSTPSAVHRLVQTISGMLEFRKLFALSRQSSRVRRQKAFGTRAVTQFFSLTGQTGSLAYMAPEVFCEKRYNHAADVFSFAILAFETLNLVHPYLIHLLNIGGFSQTETSDTETMVRYARSVSEGYRVKLDRKWPSNLAQLLQDCWEQHPENRPPMNDVVIRLEEIYKNCTTDDVFLTPKWKCWCTCTSMYG